MALGGRIVGGADWIESSRWRELQATPRGVALVTDRAAAPFWSPASVPLVLNDPGPIDPLVSLLLAVFMSCF